MICHWKGDILLLKEIIASIEIRSNPEKVWKVLTDFQLYKYWNPFIIEIVGSPTKGEKIKIELRTAAQNKGGSPNRIEMAWKGSSPFNIKWRAYIYNPRKWRSWINLYSKRDIQRFRSIFGGCQNVQWYTEKLSDDEF